MAQDYAKKSKPRAPRGKAPASRTKAPAVRQSSPWRWFSAGVITGIGLSLLLYLGTLAPGMQHTNRSPAPTAEQPPKPRYDFYTLLPEQTIDIEVDPDEIPEHPPATGDKDEVYLLQAGSFKQREDADRRRAELLLLGLNPKVEQVTSDSGNWFRVYLGPFESRLSLNKARGLTASQNIDTLLLRRAMP